MKDQMRKMPDPELPLPPLEVSYVVMEYRDRFIRSRFRRFLETWTVRFEDT